MFFLSYIPIIFSEAFSLALNRTIIIDRLLIIGKEGGENNKGKQERAGLEVTSR